MLSVVTACLRLRRRSSEDLYFVTLIVNTHHHIHQASGILLRIPSHLVYVLGSGCRNTLWRWWHHRSSLRCGFCVPASWGHDSASLRSALFRKDGEPGISCRMTGTWSDCWLRLLSIICSLLFPTHHQTSTAEQVASLHNTTAAADHDRRSQFG